VQGINGRKMFETWFQMEALLATGKLNLEPAITHRLKLGEFERAMELLRTGEAIKVVMKPE
jgi:threonine 3-dehydrogenase